LVTIFFIFRRLHCHQLFFCPHCPTTVPATLTTSLFDFFTQILPSSLPWRAGSSHVVRNHPWPVHSPDLTPLDYFLWECLQDRVYANNPQTAGDALKNNIRREIRGIARERDVGQGHYKF